MTATHLPEKMFVDVDADDDSLWLLLDAIEQSHQREADLRQEIAALKQTIEELQQESRRKDDFLAQAGHEFGNYVCPISLALEGFKRSSNKTSAFDFLMRALNASLPQLSRFTKRVQDFSRREQEECHSPKQVIGISELVQRAVDTIDPLAKERNHAVVVRNLAKSTEVFVDTAAFEQALVNLLNNAVKYTNAGGQIEVETGREAEHVVVRVRDTGIGMTEQTLPVAFASHGRGNERKRTGWHGGFGIGLAFVKTAVEFDNGCVQATSEGIGKGSTFTIRIPAFSSEA